MTSETASLYSFGDIRVDPVAAVVRRDGVEQELRLQSFRVLLYLLEHRDRIVTKDELIDWVWKDTVVVDDALVQCISEVRRVVGDEPREPWFLRTIRGAGYRVIAAVSEVPRGDDPGQVQQPEAPPRRPGSRWWPALITGAIVTVAVIALATWRSPRTPERPATRGRVAVVMAPFENLTQSPDVEWLRNGLPDMLSTQLSRDGRLSLLGSGNPRWLLEQRGGVTADVASLLGAARGVKADRLISGKFSRVGPRIRIDAQLHNVDTGALVIGESIVVPLDEVLMRVDTLALTMAAHAAGAQPSPAVRNERLTDAMTGNIEAYRLYSLGLSRAKALRVDEAVALFQRAVALDPGFAMAHARIGYAYAVIGVEADKARPHLQRARQLESRLTEKDRLQLAAWHAIANLDYISAIQHYRFFINRYPTDVEAHLQLATLLSGEEQLEESVEILRRALVIDPNSPEAYNQLGAVYSMLGRHDESIAARSRYVALLPQESNAHDSLGLSHQGAGQYAAAIRDYERALQLDPNFEIARVHLSNVYAQTGRYRKAVEELERFVAGASSETARGRGLEALSFLHRARGDLEAAEREGRKAAAIAGHYWKGVRLALIEQGRLDEAAAFRSGPDMNDKRYTGRGARPQLRVDYYVLGMEALRRGQNERALDLFRQTLRHQPMTWFLESFDTCLADAWVALGKYDEAIREYGVALQKDPNYGLTHYLLGVAHDRAGDSAAARAAYTRFLALWKDADADGKAVVAARQRLAALQ